MTNERRTRSMSRNPGTAARAPSKIPAPKRGTKARGIEIPGTDATEPGMGKDTAAPAALEEPQVMAADRNDPLANENRGRSGKGRPAEHENVPPAADDMADVENAIAEKLMRNLSPALDRIFDRLEYLENLCIENSEADKAFRRDELNEDEPRGKGKAPDPKEWGNIQISPEELSAQKELLQEYNQQREITPDAHMSGDKNSAEAHMNELYAAYIKEKARVEKERRATTAEVRISDSPMSRDVETFIGLGAGFEMPKPARRPDNLLPSAQLNPDSLVARQLVMSGGNMNRDEPAGDFFITTSGATGRAQPRFRPLPPTEVDKYHGDDDPVKFLKFVAQCK